MTFDELTLVLSYLERHPEVIISVLDDYISANLPGNRYLSISSSCGGSCVLVQYINEIEHDITLNNENLQYLENYRKKLKEAAAEYSYTNLMKDTQWQ